ncbi:MAG: T9SS type A sorting domain-containing protein, partial [Chitinophagaceae bacterium]|nr:T9SS type A sorting domain-containing protein [Chitinophagaceae bacterium]
DVADYSIYPNPTRELLQIHSDTPLEQIELFDLNGRCIQKQGYPSNTHSTQLPLGSLSPGLYILCIDKKIKYKINVW